MIFIVLFIVLLPYHLLTCSTVVHCTGMKEWMVSNTAAPPQNVHELSWWDEHSLDNNSSTTTIG